MKIAIISSGFLPVVDGVTVTILHRLRYLDRLGHQVLLFCPDYSVIKSIYPKWRDYTGQIFPNVRVVNLPSTSFLDIEFERNVSRKSYQIVLKELKTFQPDIIHIDEPERLWLGFLQRPGIDFARQMQIPCICFFHTNFIEYIEDYFSLPKPILSIVQFVMKFHRNWIYNSYDLILVSGLSTSRKVSKLGFKKVISANLLGVDLSQYEMTLRDSNFFEKRYGIAGLSHKIKLIFLGRLTPEKGWSFTLDCLTNFADNIDFNNLVFLIAGDGSMRDYIAKKLSHLTSDFYFLGRILPDDIPALLINSDLHITASEKETKGLTVLEAQAAGIAVLAPRAEGIVDSIEEGNNGLLFQPKNEKDFIEKLNLLCQSSRLRQKIGAKAREGMVLHDWEQATKNLLKIWEEQIELKKVR